MREDIAPTSLYESTPHSQDVLVAVYCIGLYLLLMVGDDTTDKVGVGVPQGSHQFGQLFFVELSHCSEHTLPGFKGPWQR